MAFMEVVPVLFPATFVALLMLERAMPARSLPHVRGWMLKGILFFLGGSALNAVIPVLVLDAIKGRSLLHLGHLGTLSGAFVMLLFSDVLGYWIHRGLHASERVWRLTHQLHHSAERMDMAGAFFFHPLDVLAQQVVPGIVVVALLGVSPTAGALGGFLGFLFGVAPHANIRTPAWLGYVFQRPEMHAVHHERGVHAYNYGGLALSDLLFGTWRNPKTFPQGEYGFWHGASSRLGAMFLCRDVTRQTSEGAS